MLIYLATNSQPDITFATSHYARFTSCPKGSHEQELVYLIKYLKKTGTRGLILRPKQSLELDLYCDANFAGLGGLQILKTKRHPKANLDGLSHLAVLHYFGIQSCIQKQLCQHLNLNT